MLRTCVGSPHRGPEMRGLGAVGAGRAGLGFSDWAGIKCSEPALARRTAGRRHAEGMLLA